MMTRSTRMLCFEALEKRQVFAISATGTPILVNPPAIGEQRIDIQAAATAFLRGGETVAVFEGRGALDATGIFVRRFDAAGAVLGGTATANLTTAGKQSHATVAALPSGGFIVAWQGRGVGDREGIFARWYDAAGAPVTEEVRINQTVGGAQLNPRVSIASDGTGIFVWHGVGAGDVDGVFARRCSASGVALSDEMLVNSTTARSQAFADVAFDGDDAALVTWSSRRQDGGDWGVYARRIELEGSPLGAEFRVNTTTAGSQTGSSVAALDAGFAVAWQSRGQDEDGWEVYAQQLNSLGGLVGSEFRLNTATAGNQHEVALAAADDGRVLAAWTDGVPDGTGWNVKGRDFDLTLAAPAFADEFVVNATTASSVYGHQRAPSVAIRSNLAAIAYSGDGATDHDGVYLQRYALGENEAPNLAPIPAQNATVGVELSIIITATDANAGDTLNYILDPDDSPAGATIEKVSHGQAIIHWMPQVSDLPGPRMFRVLVVDDGLPALADFEEFLVELTAGG